MFEIKILILKWSNNELFLSQWVLEKMRKKAKIGRLMSSYSFKTRR